MANCPQCLQPGCNPLVPGSCAQYTEINVPLLGIVTGDTLNTVVQKIGAFLAATGITTTTTTSTTEAPSD